MSEIRFYNYEFEPLCIETEIISLYKTVYYNKIGIFAVSTYNTDYILVKEENYNKALSVLSEHGYTYL